MKKYCSQLTTALALTLGIATANAGTIFYQAIPAQQSDANSGISADNQYTSAVDGGNTRGPDRVINGITLYALAADGESATADNCTVNALAGNLSNAGGGGESPSIQADGTLKDALSDMTFNNGAADNSQQEIVLDPESLEEGTTYDLRVYICNSSGQNRQVSLSFVGDGQPAVETGFFNEDDARTSAGGFKDPNQVYYINYRFIWDGDSTPGITITQKSGSAPFILYALTNQVVPGAGLATEPGQPQGGGYAQGGPGIDQGEGGDEGLSSGWVNQGDDEIGVESDEFYNAESLNSNGQWVDVEKWGNCWQPTNVPSGWCPYTNGNWKECEDCGWTFDSEEPWAWATYHYGRWCKVRRGCGWAWVPGKVWGASWVSWRRGQSGSSCDSCIGWAPLPPEAGCQIGVGISSWVDYSCDIGPDCYTFVNIRDFGCCPSYSGCGTCIIDRGTYINIYEASINITNICYDKHVNIYCGGPDYNWCNTEIRRRGGKECERIHVNRYDDPGRMGGKHWNREGNQLALHSPQINRNKNAKPGKIAEHVGRDKIDKGWGSAKANNKEKQLRNHLAQETKGKTPKNTKGTLPPGVAEKQKQHAAAAGQLGGRHPGGKGKGQGQLGAGAGQAAGGGLGQHPGGKGKGQGQLGAGAGQAAGGGLGQHPGGRGKGKGQGQMGAGAGQAAGGGFNQHPGKGQKAGKAGPGTPGSLGTGRGQGGQVAGAGGGGGKGMHPGQKKSQRGGAGGAQGGVGGGALSQAGAGGGGQHPGKRGGKGGQQFGQGGQAGGPGAAGGQVGAGGGGGKGGKHKQQQAQQGAAQPGSFGGAGGGGQKHRKQQQAQQGQQPGGQQGGFGGAGGGGQKHRKQQQAQQGQQPAGQQGGFGGAGGGGQKHRKQQQAQQFQQPAGQQGGFGGAGGGGQKHRKQQQAQQFQQPAGQQGGFGGAGGGGQKHRKQQQAQQFQQPAGQQGGGGGGGQRRQQIQQRQGQVGGGGQQQQRQGGKKGKKPTPPPF